MKKAGKRSLFFSGPVLLLFVALLFPRQNTDAMGIASGAVYRQHQQVQPRARIRKPLFFAVIKVAFSGKTKSDDSPRGSFQSVVIDALNEIDQKNQELLDQVIGAADAVGDAGETNVTLDQDNNVGISVPSGAIVLEWTGTKLKVKGRPGRLAIRIDCFPLLVQKRLRSIRGIGKVNTSRLNLFAEPKDFAQKLRQKLCL